MEFDRTTTYLNESERNIHVWASETNSSNAYLVAGCYTSGNLKNVTFLDWLNLIIATKTREGFNLALYKLPEVFFADWINPKTRTKEPLHIELERIVRSVTTKICVDMRKVTPLPAGHYVVLQQRGRTFKEIKPTLRESPIRRRARSRTPSGLVSPATPSKLTVPGSSKLPRDSAIPEAVRIRDLRCRVTGSEAQYVPRGWSFSALEVAHIFPLRAHGEVEEICSNEPNVLKLIKSTADIACNAMLLKADIHTYFDRYEFGVYKEEFHKFERSGARDLELKEHKTLLPMQTKVSDVRFKYKPHDVPEVSRTLLDHHFLNGLLWHVAGFGLGRATTAMGGIVP